MKCKNGSCRLLYAAASAAALAVLVLHHTLPLMRRRQYVRKPKFLRDFCETLDK
ncbi:MAG: hypothetical protein IKD06_03140 [Clostridia bacterium]|nr:hypothetical protein [Clostridia bacterium]